MIQTTVGIIVIAIAAIYFAYINAKTRNARKSEERIKAAIVGSYENACRYYEFNGTTIIDPISVQRCVIDRTFALKVTSCSDGTFIDTYIKYDSDTFADNDYLSFYATFGVDIFRFNDERGTLIILDKKYFKNFNIESREGILYLTIYNNYNWYKYTLNYGYEFIKIGDKAYFELEIKNKFKIEEEQKMRDFKVGDIIKGKKNDMYIITDEDMYKAKVLRTYDDRMEIQILEYNSNYGFFIGKKYIVLNSKQYFELVKANKFYKTLPNDFTGKLTIDKGQVVEKEEKGNILDEVEKEYLRAVIKPFREKVKYICKAHNFPNGIEHIMIVFKDSSHMFFPPFEMWTMYKGMKSCKEYTLEELGL